MVPGSHRPHEANSSPQLQVHFTSPVFGGSTIASGSSPMMGRLTLERDGVELRPRQVGSELHLRFSGSAGVEVEPLLPEYFVRVHEEVQRLGLAQVVVDVRELHFISSSCFKALISWIGEVNALPVEQRYRIRFLKDPKLRWQARSFDALHRLCMSHVFVEDG